MRRVLTAVTAAVLAMLLAPALAAAQTPQAPAPQGTPHPSATPAPGTEPWWLPVAFQGQTVSDVRVDSGQITVNVAGLGLQQSVDGGRTWQPHVEPGGLQPPAGGEWQVRGDRIGRVDATGTWQLDPGSPRVTPPTTAGHSPVAALPGGTGQVVAVDTDGVVWRRGGDGAWARALLLLPQDAIHGPPKVTGVASFTQPLSSAVYLATDGYAVLLSTDGGDFWVRGGPGLPDGVLAITTDSSHRAVYAGTRDGLWLHHLQPTPKPPAYAAQDLRSRWLGTAAVSLLAAALGIGGLLLLMRPRPQAALRDSSGT